MNGIKLILVFLGIAWLLSGISGIWNNYNAYEKEKRDLVEARERIEQESKTRIASLEKKIDQARRAEKEKSDLIRKKIERVKSYLAKETIPIQDMIDVLRKKLETAKDKMSIDILGTRIKNLERKLAAKSERPKLMIENGVKAINEAEIDLQTTVSQIEKEISKEKFEAEQKQNAKTKAPKFKYLSIIAAIIGLLFLLFGVFIGVRQPVIVE